MQGDFIRILKAGDVLNPERGRPFGLVGRQRLGGRTQEFTALKMAADGYVFYSGDPNL